MQKRHLCSRRWPLVYRLVISPSQESRQPLGQKGLLKFGIHYLSHSYLIGKAKRRLSGRILFTAEPVLWTFGKQLEWSWILAISLIIPRSALLIQLFWVSSYRFLSSYDIVGVVILIPQSSITLNWRNLVSRPIIELLEIERVSFGIPTEITNLLGSITRLLSIQINHYER